MNTAIMSTFCGALLLFACADYDLLDKEDEAPKQPDIRIVQVTDSSVTLRWTQCTDDNFQCYKVLYGISDVVDLNDKIADSLMFSIDTQKTVKPLDDNTHYYFRVLVVNDLGKFSASATVDTITPENMRNKLKLAEPLRNEDGDVAVSWSSAITTFDRYALFADTVRTVDTTDTLIATAYTDTTDVISGLTADKTWWIRVYALEDTIIRATSNTVEIKAVE